MKNTVVDSSFLRLSQVNVNEQTKKKNGLTYLSWAWAWAELKKLHPDAEWEVQKFWNKDLEIFVPYLFDPNLGYMVETSVSIDGITHTISLPVMDGGNNSMTNERYSYKVQDAKWVGGKRVWDGVSYLDKWVEKATMFDINTAIMRCLVKNIGLHGLGLYIYAGEDLPYDPLVDGDTIEQKIVIAPIESTFVGTVSGTPVEDFVLAPEPLSEPKGPGVPVEEAPKEKVKSPRKTKTTSPKAGAIQPSAEFDQPVTKAEVEAEKQAEESTKEEEAPKETKEAPEPPKEESTKEVSDEEMVKRKAKAKAAYAKLDTPKVLEHLIRERNLKFVSVNTFIEQSPIELVQEVYDSVKGLVK